MPSLFSRPLPLAFFAFFVLCCVLHPESPLHTHQLLDTDDYMRLNEVSNWMQSAHPFGADWYDLSQPRLSPGEHVVVHWARLIDIPIAAVAWPLVPKLGMQGAILAASFVVPPLTFILLLLIMPALARPIVGRQRADLACVMLLFAPSVLLNFVPGRVDHHGYQVIIGAFALLALQRMILCPRGWKLALAVAFAFAAGLWIGTEAMPWLVLFSGCLALLSGWRGGVALRNAGVFGLALPVAVGITMLFAIPPAEYTSRALSWFSGADLIFAALAGSVFFFGWLGGRQTSNAWLRLILMAALGFFAALLFIYLVPDTLTGAYADYDTFFNDTLIENIGEAQPFLPSLHVSIYSPESYTHAALLILRTIFLPCIATIIVCWNLIRRRGRTQMVWFMHAFFLLPALCLTLFWQVRIGWFLQAYAIMPVTWLVWKCWTLIGEKRSPPLEGGVRGGVLSTDTKDSASGEITPHQQKLRLSENAKPKFLQPLPQGERSIGRKRFWAEIAAFVVIAPLPILLVPAIISEARLYPDVLLFPAAHAATACPLIKASALLDDAYRNRPRMILSGMNEGPELLFRTPHNVLAAPYNVDGNKDAFDFFNARDERKAVAVVLRRHVDLVLVCRSIPPFYAGLASFNKRFNAYLSQDSKGHLRMSSSRDHPTLIERLVEGDIPAWLKPVAIPLDTDYLLFEVKT